MHSYDFFGLVECGVDAVGDEVEGCTSLHFERLAGVMCQDKHGRVIRRILAPPAVPGIVCCPWTLAATEHVSSHDSRPDVRERFGGDLIVRTRDTVIPPSIPWSARKR